MLLEKYYCPMFAEGEKSMMMQAIVQYAEWI
jgi:hypothetical protein